MLYLPPGVAHHGVADSECMTYSIGFRAPSDAELLADFAGWLAQKADAGGRYADPDLQLDEAEAGQIASSARERIRTKLRHYLAMDDAELDRWFGCFITEPKPWLVAAPPDEAIAAADLIARLRAGEWLQRAPAARINFIPGTLFCDGKAYDLPSAAADIAPLLACRRSLSWADLAASLKIDATVALLTDLYNAGKYYFND
jgi:50S ribosomal protein L16 3-hydroxylase